MITACHKPQCRTGLTSLPKEDVLGFVPSLLVPEWIHPISSKQLSSAGPSWPPDCTLCSRNLSAQLDAATPAPLFAASLNVNIHAPFISSYAPALILLCTGLCQSGKRCMIEVAPSRNVSVLVMCSSFGGKKCGV